MDARYFASKKNKKLLDLKNTRLWKIVQSIDNKAYELAILETLKTAGLMPIFHPWKLHLTLNNPFLEQILLSDPPIEISAKNDKHKDHKE